MGLERGAPDLFSGIPWGSEHVLTRTLERIAALGLDARVLESLQDIDRPEDLPPGGPFIDVSRLPLPLISVIIPTLKEGENVLQTIEAVGRQPGVELILADGGSTDNTLELAGPTGARIVESSPGRARQMNAGATEARGHILLFLHAGTLLPPGFEDQGRGPVTMTSTLPWPWC